MYFLACGALLATAVVLNLREPRMLALTALVGVSVFLPVPAHSQLAFYGSCVTMELLVGISAILLRPRGGLIIFEMCVALILAHIMGYALDGSPPLSPYRIIVKLLELSQLAACVALSPVLLPVLRNHDATTA